jgi:hypothetical protein
MFIGSDGLGSSGGKREKRREKMKKLSIFFLSCLFIFASSASAAVYKWVDERGVLNFADDYSKVPPDYRNKVEEVNITRMGPLTPSQVPPGQIGVGPQPGEVATQAPPIAQTLIREGDFAVKLAEALKIGQAQSDAEAEDMLASVSITPKNGWIADYPVTPDIIGELQNAIGSAVDAGKLAMRKGEAVKVFQDLIAQQGLPVRADEREYAGSEGIVEPPPSYGDYSNYYYNQGPPIVTYYPPPWDYYYMYAWVPYPFWYSGFWFPGFFCLRDFHRVGFMHGRQGILSNHFIDPRTRRVVSIDPATRGTGGLAHSFADVSSGRGFTSPQAVRGAASILERSQGQAKLGNAASSGSGGVAGRQVFSNRGSNTTMYRGKVGTARPLATNYWMGRSQAAILSRNMGGSAFSHRGGFGFHSGMGFGSSTSGRSFGGFHGGRSTGSRGSSGGGRGGHR